MKRELKFRVWDVPNREWLRLRDDGNYGTPDNIAMSSLDFCCRSDHFVVQQFTGLLDKNGQEIYEGDIVRRSDGLPMQGKSTIIIPLAANQVYFAEGSFRLRRGLKSKKFPLRSSIIRQNGIEVIGNIHQHPQLLKGWNDGSTA